MKLLLDTHVWVWTQLEPQRISRRVAQQLESPDNQLWLSPISVWELGVLVAKRRVVLNEDLDVWIPKALAGPLIEAAITHEVALETRRVSLPHRDPADIFLVATA